MEIDLCVKPNQTHTTTLSKRIPFKESHNVQNLVRIPRNSLLMTKENNGGFCRKSLGVVLSLPNAGNGELLHPGTNDEISLDSGMDDTSFAEEDRFRSVSNANENFSQNRPCENADTCDKTSIIESPSTDTLEARKSPNEFAESQNEQAQTNDSSSVVEKAKQYNKMLASLNDLKRERIQMKLLLNRETSECSVKDECIASLKARLSDLCADLESLKSAHDHSLENKLDLQCQVKSLRESRDWFYEQLQTVKVSRDQLEAELKQYSTLLKESATHSHMIAMENVSLQTELACAKATLAETQRKMLSHLDTIREEMLAKEAASSQQRSPASNSMGLATACEKVSRLKQSLENKSADLTLDDLTFDEVVDEVNSFVNSEVYDCMSEVGVDALYVEKQAELHHNLKEVQGLFAAKCAEFEALEIEKAAIDEALGILQRENDDLNYSLNRALQDSRSKEERFAQHLDECLQTTQQKFDRVLAERDELLFVQVTQVEHLQGNLGELSRLRELHKNLLVEHQKLNDQYEEFRKDAAVQRQIAIENHSLAISRLQDNFSREVAEKTRLIDNLKEQLCSQQQRTDAIRSACKESEEEREIELTYQAADMLYRYSDLEAQLLASETMEQQLREDLAKEQQLAQQNCDMFEKELALHKEQYQQLSSVSNEMETLRSKHDRAIAELSALREKHHALTDSYTNFKIQTDASIDDLQRRLDKAEEGKLSNQLLIDQLQTLLAQSNSQLATCEERLREQASQLDEKSKHELMLSSTIKNCHEQLAAASKDKESLLQEKARAEETLTALRVQADGLSGDLRGAEVLADTLNAQLKESRLRCEKLLEENNQLTSTIDAKIVELNALLVAKNSLEQTLTDLRSEHDEQVMNLKSQLANSDELEQQFTQQSADYDALKTEKDCLEEAVACLADEIEQYKDKFDANVVFLEQCKVESARTIATLQIELAQAEASLREEKTHTERLCNDLHAKDQAHDALTREKAQLQSTIVTITSDNATHCHALQEQINQLTLEKNKLESEMQRVSQTLEERRPSPRASECTLNEQGSSFYTWNKDTAAYEALVEEKEALEEALFNLQDECEDLRLQLVGKVEEMNEQKNAMEQLLTQRQKLCDEVQADCELLQQHVVGLERRERVVSRDCDELKNRLAERSAEFDSLLEEKNAVADALEQMQSECDELRNQELSKVSDVEIVRLNDTLQELHKRYASKCALITELEDQLGLVLAMKPACDAEVQCNVSPVLQVMAESCHTGLTVSCEQTSPISQSDVLEEALVMSEYHVTQQVPQSESASACHIVQLQDNCADLQEQLNATKDLYETVCDKLNDCEKRDQETKLRQDHHERLIAELRQQKEELRMDNDDKHKQLEMEKQAVELLVSQVKEKTALSQAIFEKQNEIKQLSEKLAETTQNERTATMRLTELDCLLASTRGHCTELEAQKLQKEAALTTLETAHAELKQRYEQLSYEARDTQLVTDELASVQVQLAEAERQNVNLSLANDQLSVELKKFKILSSQLESQLTTQEEVVSVLRRQAEQVRLDHVRKLATFKADKFSLESQLTQLTATLTETSQQLHEKESLLASTEKQLVKFKHEQHLQKTLMLELSQAKAIVSSIEPILTSLRQESEEQRLKLQHKEAEIAHLHVQLMQVSDNHSASLAQLEHLKKELQEKVAKLRLMQGEDESKNELIETLQKRLDALTNEVVEKTMQLNVADAKHAAELESVNCDRRHMQEHLASNEEDLAALKSIVANAQNDLADMRALCEALKSERMQQTAKIEQLQREKLSAEQHLVQLNEKNAAFEQKLTEQVECSERERQRVLSLQTALQKAELSMTEFVQTKQLECENLSGQLADYRQRNATVTRELDQARDELGQLQLQKDTHEATIANLRRTNAEIEEKSIQKIESLAANHQSALAAEQTNLRQLREQMETLGATLNDTKGRLAATEGLLEVERSSQAQQKDQLDAERNQRHQLEMLASQLEAENAKLRNTFTSNEEQAVLQKQQLHSQIYQLQSDLAKCQLAIQGLHEVVEASKARENELLATKDGLEIQLSNYESKLQNATSCQSDNKKMQHKLSQAHVDRQRASEELDRLNAELKQKNEVLSKLRWRLQQATDSETLKGQHAAYSARVPSIDFVEPVQAVVNEAPPVRENEQSVEDADAMDSCLTSLVDKLRDAQISLLRSQASEEELKESLRCSEAKADKALAERDLALADLTSAQQLVDGAARHIEMLNEKIKTISDEKKSIEKAFEGMHEFLIQVIKFNRTNGDEEHVNLRISSLQQLLGLADSDANHTAPQADDHVSVTSSIDMLSLDIQGYTNRVNEALLLFQNIHDCKIEESSLPA